MARIAGVDIPNQKRIEIALTYIYGIGRKTANQILAATHNQHKIAEFQEMLTANHLEIQIVNPSTFSGFPELIENGETSELDALGQ